MLKQEREFIVNELLSSKFLKDIAARNVHNEAKDPEESDRYRKEGNALYALSGHSAVIHEKILTRYTQSLAFAPSNSLQMALAYSNRSALLYHCGKYVDCMLDIERAMRYEPLCIKIKKKLIDRKVMCLKYFDGEVFDRLTANDESSTKDADRIEMLTKLLEKSKLEDQKLVSQKLVESTDKVAIKYNATFGRHLVATKNIEPGEIIFVQKPYVSHLNVRTPYSQCCNCLSYAYSSIPCENCNWFVFCSEKCKVDALENSHPIECSIVPYILHFLGVIQQQVDEKLSFDGLSIKAFLKYLKIHGNNLEKLSKELEIIENSKDERCKGFIKNGKIEIDDFRSLFSLTHEYPVTEMRRFIIFASVTLVCLMKFTNIFGKVEPFPNLQAVANLDSRAVFVGALLLRLVQIISINSHVVMNSNDNCKYGSSMTKCRAELTCIRGVSITPLASLINHSCNPNARRCFGKNQEFILYAIQPIKKNYQIFDCYYCPFYDGPVLERANMLKMFFGFNCKCDACLNKWTHYSLTQLNSKNLDNVPLNTKEMSTWKKNQELIMKIEAQDNFDKIAALNIMSKAISYSVLHLPQDSIITCKLFRTLVKLFEDTFGYDTQVFNHCYGQKNVD
ncbi:SET and MYND domain-containing protein 4-like [Trichogramma pretiosum]|uniref:SET and MYND domain-containing protein 4-like n=1 Tax=Trichogramma pretiosum TaxID=7493 RepID=UPI0006C9BF09|nr:SET and MYND domain-containing protein 4-like [Trichogramma pretiosum]XP_014222569.1 SET and MYND domain-containing protein 4-like [Trichogramma pretiosum]